MDEIRSRSTLDSSNFQAGAKKMKREVGGVKDSLKGMKGMIAGAFSVGAVVAFTKNVIDLGSHISDMALQAGLTTDEFQALEMASIEAGVSADKVQTAMAKINVVLGQAKRGMKTYVDLFEEIGISQEQLANLNTKEALQAVAKAMDEAEQGSTQFGAALEIIGTRSGAKMLEVLQRINREGLDQLIAKGKEAGMIMEEDLVKKLDSAADKLAIFERTAQSTFATWAAGLAEAVEQLAEFVAGFSEGVFKDGIKLDIVTPWGQLREFKNAYKEGMKAVGTGDRARTDAKIAEKKALEEKQQREADRLADKQAAEQKKREQEQAAAAEKQSWDNLGKGRVDLFDHLEQQEKMAKAEKAKAVELAEKKDKDEWNQVNKGLDQINAAQNNVTDFGSIMADRLARIGGQVGGASSPALRIAQRQIAIQEQIARILQEHPQKIAERLKYEMGWA